MELLKVDKAPAEFKWQDVTFRFRRQVTVEDKFAIDTAGGVIKGDQVEFQPWEFYKTLVRVFVTSWDGVTQDGKPVPYAYETLLKLPSETSEDLIMKLGYAIAVETGLVKPKDEGGDLKNVSSGPSNG